MLLNRLYALAVGTLFALCAGCSVTSAEAGATSPPTASASASILQMSVPAAGSTVKGPVSDLELHFNPAALLNEVMVAGPQGAMPMMITSVGEAQHYSIPLPDLENGSYTVTWRANSGGKPHEGTFSFKVE